MNSSSSSPSRSSMSTAAVVGGSTSNVALSAEEFPFLPDPVCIHDLKDEAMLVLKADLKAALDKEVKSMDEESWKFEGPRSRINLLSKPGDRGWIVNDNVGNLAGRQRSAAGICGGRDSFNACWCLLSLTNVIYPPRRLVFFSCLLCEERSLWVYKHGLRHVRGCFPTTKI
ncbi:protein SAMBA isoform X1 [Rhodamnia argentea]|uniref:Protein SAMBA isoform X1 n=1 Tax=Rhodamnia argentea TaxID=178133 RepID=A0ABM3H586_9MYRT|nr:protein SAMBA isoform X1 [Rhodamnia argentea]XP_048131737.1 protein SAMBA isoform X1 [Rhodamnia argentea]